MKGSLIFGWELCDVKLSEKDNPFLTEQIFRGSFPLQVKTNFGFNIATVSLNQF